MRESYTKHDTASAGAEVSSRSVTSNGVALEPGSHVVVTTASFGAVGRHLVQEDGELVACEGPDVPGAGSPHANPALQWTVEIRGNVAGFLHALDASLDALASLRALPTPDVAAVQSHCDEITQLLGAAYAALDLEVT